MDNSKDKIVVKFTVARFLSGTEMDSDRYNIVFSAGVGMLSHNFSSWRRGRDYPINCLNRLIDWATQAKKMACSNIANAEYIVLFQNGGGRVGERVSSDQFLVVSRAVADVFGVMLADQVDENRILGDHL